MRWLTKAVAVVLATGTGLAVGCAGGAAFALFTWGLSLGLGLIVGGMVGAVAGVVAVADGDGRYMCAGPPAGIVVGLVASGGWVAYMAMYGPGSGPLTAGDRIFLAAWFIGGAATGFFAGLLAERVGRAVAGSN